MSLVVCPDCGSSISVQAPACPRCGRPMPGQAHIVKTDLGQGLKSCLMIVLAIIAGIALLFYFTAAKSCSTFQEYKEKARQERLK